jgi:hypothetical protein
LAGIDNLINTLTYNINAYMSQSSSDLSIIRVSGSNPSPSQHVAANVVNTNPDTHFSAAGVGSFIDMEIAKESEFNTIVIQFFNGRHKKTKFSIAQTKDFQKFEPVEPSTFVSNFDDDNQTFHFKKTKAKGIRLSFEGNVSDAANKGPINGVAGTGTANGRPTHLGVIQNNTYNPGPLSYSADPSEVNTNSVLRPTHLGVIQQTLSDNRSLFEVRSIAILNTDLEKDQEKIVNEQVKAAKEATKDCDNCKCVRCGEKTVAGICPKCGLKGDYSHPEAAHIQEAFPINATSAHTAKLDTTPSPTQPPAVSTRPITTVLPGQAAQAGNTVQIGTEVIPEGAVSNVKVDEIIANAQNLPTNQEGKVNVTHYNETGFGNENTPTKQATDAANQGKTTNQTADDRSIANTPYVEGDHYQPKDVTVSNTKDNTLQSLQKQDKHVYDNTISNNISQKSTSNQNNKNNTSTQTQSNTANLSKDDQSTPIGQDKTTTVKKTNKDGTVVENKNTTTIK